MSRFDYLLAKVSGAPFLKEPFTHVYIEDFFAPQDFAQIIAAPEIAVPAAKNDADLIDLLHAHAYKEIVFPGTTTDIAKYLAWHAHPDKSRNTNVETCEGFGVTLRLQKAQEGSIVSELEAFFSSDIFLQTLAQKFSVDLDTVYADRGLQKYLDGYEISPHPDGRKKALTYMINVNPDPASESHEHHTHYMRFKPERAYVGAYWEGNPSADRCWVPWEWCETVTEQRKNNSIVLFAPSDNTLHAVRARYNHLAAQRTQLYGNLWRKVSITPTKPNWRDFEIKATKEMRNGPLWKRTVATYFPNLVGDRVMPLSITPSQDE